MITPDKLKQLTSFSPKALAKVLDVSGYSMASFASAQFEGITADGDFCYKVTYYDEAGTGEEEGKVYLTYFHNTGLVRADY